MEGILVILTFVVGLSAILFGLARFLDTERHVGAGRRVRPSQFTIGQVMAAVIVAALLIHVATYRGPGDPPSLIVLSLILLGWFVRHWRKEFVFLMGLRDEDFPGRHDKPIWVAMVLFLAPIGVWFFRAYRLAHWPEPAPAILPEHGAEEAGGAAAQPA
jgi:hypothetical protein